MAELEGFEKVITSWSGKVSSSFFEWSIFGRLYEVTFWQYEAAELMTKQRSNMILFCMLKSLIKPIENRYGRLFK